MGFIKELLPKNNNGTPDKKYYVVIVLIALQVLLAILWGAILFYDKVIDTHERREYFRQQQFSYLNPYQPLHPQGLF